ncbi:NfeD family protein [Oscillatoria sp. FACHB-1406]|uniref:NfeD family protein n=1 Tax=Oscillatoria sp. FACHB-1406 TaxID=2692846 RepID=UPI0016872BD3|nr:NfeD family protein [Oscillatoria sp. FACHB-1406]MBD2578928.1 NfeD family protein [Oscillatoria sp. FACHB-1406]
MSDPTLLWALAGAILCLMELFFPTAFIEFMMGLSAFLVAIVSLRFRSLTLQIALWLLCSVLFVVLTRRFLSPKPSNLASGDDRCGETLTEIPPGKAGRVLYEGNSWRARCGDENCAIAPSEPVYIIGREGNTLIVMPQNILNS